MWGRDHKIIEMLMNCVLERNKPWCSFEAYFLHLADLNKKYCKFS
jgi:hypothetical protein